MYTKKEITSPYFETAIQRWAYRGSIKKPQRGEHEVALLQTFYVAGTNTGQPIIKTKWSLYRIDKGKNKELTINGIVLDVETKLAILQRETLLSQEEIFQLQTYANHREVDSDEALVLIKKHIEPILREKTKSVQDDMGRISLLMNEFELVEFMKTINALLPELHYYYPRSYEFLIETQLKIRERYAELKYPELYSQIIALKENSNYMLNPSDEIMGFGYGKVLRTYYDLFMKNPGDPNQSDIPISRINSPLEERGATSIFFT